MKWFFTTFPLAIALSAGSVLPAAAEVYEDRLSDLNRGGTLSRSERAERQGVYVEERGTRSERRRVARAVVTDDDDFDYSARHSARHNGARAHYKSRAARHTRHAALERPRAYTGSPKWSRRSISAGGGRSSGQSGMASYYWQGQRVASGGWFNPNAMTAAHRSLPFGTRVRVTHAGSGRSVDVVINDRGPFVAGRIIDLSRGAASALGMTAQGVARVTLSVLGR